MSLQLVQHELRVEKDDYPAILDESLKYETIEVYLVIWF